ncbi:MAG TPA: CPBP family glutamic-type intramembrane protease [Candidatus Saccharimonadales bacterium]|nr:CPBP family glutamic-type intramembrane protease [Candidatus Saccharimonadales bacterium]
MQKYLKPFSLILLLTTALVLIPFEMKPLGWTLWVITVAVLLFTEKHYRRDMLLVVASLGLLGITQINTDISLLHMFEMGTTLFLAVAIPFFITRRLYKEKTIRYPFHHGRAWYKSEISYIFITALIAYLILPFYLSNTGAYRNWTVEPGFNKLLTLFIGTNGLGTWDEFFFVSTVLAIFKKYFPFPIANASQAVCFTGFLFELGFRGWAPFILYPFALTQGYIFKKTDSLLYVITIHLTLDLVLYLALVHAHYPDWIRIFIT